jgi:RTX calcium-binding nonapeptide repeat (4 copies)
MPRRVRLAPFGLVVACLLSAVVAAPAAAAPPNDDFAEAGVLEGFPTDAEASNAGATREAGEPVHGYPGSLPGDHSLWWRWTAERSGHVGLRTCGSSVETSFSVYTGTELTELEAVGGARESSPRPCEGADEAYGPPARVAFFATAGKVYYFAVDSAPFEAPERAVGRVRLELRQAGSVGVRLVTGESGTLAKLVYRAAPGESNSANISLDWAPGPRSFTGRPEPPSPPVSYLLEEEVSPGPGCERDYWDVICAIPPGTRATGPLVHLGDRDDAVNVNFSRAGTQIFGGAGDDFVAAGGRVSTGPGNDEIEARAWVRSQITGGSGNDTITGSLREDVIDPGPGNDSVNGRDSKTPVADLIRSRDRDVDTIECAGRATAWIDGLDIYGPHCSRVIRRGAARAVPDSYFTYLSDGTAQVWVDCPADGPRACVGSISVFSSGVSLRRQFKVRREDARFSEFDTFDLPASRRQLQQLAGTVKVTVRSRDRAGKLKKATRVFHDVELE